MRESDENALQAFNLFSSTCLINSVIHEQYPIYNMKVGQLSVTVISLSILYRVLVKC